MAIGLVIVIGVSVAVFIVERHVADRESAFDDRTGGTAGAADDRRFAEARGLWRNHRLRLCGARTDADGWRPFAWLYGDGNLPIHSRRMWHRPLRRRRPTSAARSPPAETPFTFGTRQRRSLRKCCQPTRAAISMRDCGASLGNQNQMLVSAAAARRSGAGASDRDQRFHARSRHQYARLCGLWQWRVSDALLAERRRVQGVLSLRRRCAMPPAHRALPMPCPSAARSATPRPSMRLAGAIDPWNYVVAVMVCLTVETDEIGVGTSATNTTATRCPSQRRRSGSRAGFGYDNHRRTHPPDLFASLHRAQSCHSVAFNHFSHEQAN